MKKYNFFINNTIQRIHQQHAALVDVIQFLDSNGHSNNPIRETVDKVLNGSKWEKLEQESNKEIEIIQLKARAK